MCPPPQKKNNRIFFKKKIATIGIETKELAKTAKEEEGGKRKKRVA